MLNLRQAFGVDSELKVWTFCNAYSRPRLIYLRLKASHLPLFESRIWLERVQRFICSRTETKWLWRKITCRVILAWRFGHQYMDLLDLHLCLFPRVKAGALTASVGLLNKLDLVPHWIWLLQEDCKCIDVCSCSFSSTKSHEARWTLKLWTFFIKRNPRADQSVLVGDNLAWVLRTGFSFITVQSVNIFFH